MESVEVAKIKPGQSITLTFGEKEPILTKEEEPAAFKIEDWFTEEQVIYLLDPVIAEDELLHYSLTPIANPAAAMETDKQNFGVNCRVQSFLARPVEGIESEDLEESDDEEE